MAKVRTKGRVTPTLRSQEALQLLPSPSELASPSEEDLSHLWIMTARPSSLSLPSSELGSKPTFRPLQVCELAQGRLEKHPANHRVVGNSTSLYFFKAYLLGCAGS